VSEAALLPIESLHQTIAEDGFAFVRAGTMRRILAGCGPLSDWPRFAASWNDLGLDTYMADGGRYRRRRHATFSITPDGTITRRPHRPHFQGLDYNVLNGGIARWFEPIVPEIGSGPSMHAILDFCRMLFGALSAAVGAWDVEVHQFRIEAREDEQGRPTPEGVHHDGVDYVLVLLVDRRNIVSGTTTIHDAGGRQVGSFTLTDPLDAALVEDARVSHGVTPVEPIDPAAPACRDVLVVTFRRERQDLSGVKPDAPPAGAGTGRRR
jgi:hypothetical protein